MPIQLSEVEARILGSLVEKSLTTPDLYPLTYNSIISACNQKTSRDPVMELGEDAVGTGLHGLLEKGLAERVNEAGARVPKFRHRAEDLAGTADPKIVGLLTVLLLRGPQTPGELKGRTERLCQFTGTAEVESLLQDLSARPVPLVAKLPRAPGQKEARYRHLFFGDAPAPAAPSAAPAAGAASAQPDRLAELEKRVAALEARLAAFDSARAESVDRPRPA